MKHDFTGQRVTVMGLGRFGGGVGVTRWLAQRGARVTVTDLEPPEKLAASIEQLRGLDVTLRLGAHDESDFRHTDLVIANPAVKPDSPYLACAADAGVPITTEINLFLERCRAAFVGITGTVGKSTTTAMIGRILERCLRGRKTWIGGNIGGSLLDTLDEIAADDVVVLELSSFQLERTPRIAWSPGVAVITNIAPNHGDWHGSYDAYVAAKLNIARYQSPSDAVLICDRSAELNAAVDRAAAPARDRWCFGEHDGAPAAWSANTASLAAALATTTAPTVRWSNCVLQVPGRHNRLNAAAALTVACALQVSGADAAAALADFAGLEHRLQYVTERDGVRYFNDSKGTTPEALETAMSAFEQPLLLILGGYDKGADLRPVMEKAAVRSKLAACIGATGEGIAQTIRAAGGQAETCANLQAAFELCRRTARDGDVVLLSPACASWGMYSDYRARGEEFVRLARGTRQAIDRSGT